MTNDSKLFPPRPKWESQGYRPDEYSRWLKGDWRPIGELWVELGTRPLPDGERRCAQPPYDTLPVPRADLPAGIILSRVADAWIHEESIDDLALPLYEGRMIGQFDFSQKGWVSGKGRGAVWREIPWERKQIEPQFLMAQDTFQRQLVEKHLRQVKGAGGQEEADLETKRLDDPAFFATWWQSRLRRVGFMDVTSATNTRTVIASMLPAMPCGNKVPVLASQRESTLGGLLCSFPLDFQARRRLSGLSLNYFILAEFGLPKARLEAQAIGGGIGLGLAASHQLFATHWLRAKGGIAQGWRRAWAVTEYERRRLEAILNAVAFRAYGLDTGDALAILSSAMDAKDNTKSADDAKGFWRVDDHLEPELRTTALSVAAMLDLEQMITERGGNTEAGLRAFTGQDGSDGWQLPESLRLADYGIEHDSRARDHQPVASRLGTRHYGWQLEQSHDESWRECQLHARNLLGKAGYAGFQEQLASGGDARGVPVRNSPVAGPRSIQRSLL